MNHISIKVASARGVAERWMAQYLRNGEWLSTVSGSSKAIYEKLCALGPDPDIVQVAQVIGNKSWSYCMCNGCGESFERVVEFSWGEGHCLCETCLATGLKAIRGKRR